MTFRTDRAKVLGLGSAKSGADHWFGERLKSVALIPLTIIFILIVAMSSILAHYRLGNIDIKTGLVMALGGVIGAQIGPHLLQHLSDQNYKRIFSVFLVITAVWLFASSFTDSKG